MRSRAFTIIPTFAAAMGASTASMPAGASVAPAAAALSYSSTTSKILGSVTMIGGRSADGGCVFNGRTAIDAGHIDVREVSFDLASCTWVLEVESTDGLSSPSTIDLVGTGTTHVVSSSLQLPALPGQLIPAPIALDPPPKVAVGKTYWHDPPGLEVNSVTATVGFDSDGACASAGTHRSSGQDDWFIPSGWSRDFFNQSPSADCNGVRHRMDAQYTNSAFCEAVETAIGGPIGQIYAGYLPPTQTFYQPTILTGLTDGRAELYWNAAKSGNCQRLLTFAMSLNNTPSSVK